MRVKVNSPSSCYTMPVLKKRGALFPVYHDSPPTSSSKAPSKKDVLSARSPTLRHKKQSSIGSKAATSGLKPSQSSLAASAALQSQTAASRKPLGSIANASGSRAPLRDVSGKSGTAREKENLRSLGMGKQGAKMQVFVDGEEPRPMKTMETRLGTRRALGMKPAQPTHAIATLDPRKSAKSAFTVFQDPPSVRGQENIPPPGEYTADHPAPVQRSTRKSTSTFPTTFTSAPHVVTGTPSRQHDSVLDPDSPYITKPRLRKVKPASAITPNQAPLAAAEPSSQPPLVIASSQPQSQPSEPTLLSSPLVTRPQTRKQPSKAAPSASTPSHPAPPSAYSVHPDPILCDVSEAYGASPTLRPTAFDRPRRSARQVGARRQNESLPSSVSRHPGEPAFVRLLTRPFGSDRRTDGHRFQRGGIGRQSRRRLEGGSRRRGRGRMWVLVYG